ncbi:class I SAM-dependent methyltransferase [Chloroflexota bacterium]
MDEYAKGNLELWNEMTPINARSEFYDVEGFKNGRCTLESIELEEIGDVSGKSLLHLQCHFGMDTLSWARLGARVTGVDFSDKAITLARSLSKELGIEADFICSDIYKLPDVLDEKFDIVFTSRGVLCWLNDLNKWAQVISHFLKPGGTFYIVEGHPLMMVFDDSKDIRELKVTQSYFYKPEPIRWEADGAYAENGTEIIHPSYEWTHSLSDVINSLITAGLNIDFLHEFPYITYRQLPFMDEYKPGHWRIKGIDIPLTFSIKATKV